MSPESPRSHLAAGPIALSVLLYAAAIVAWDVLLLPNSGAIVGAAPFVAINVGFGLALGRWSAIGLAAIIFLLALPFIGETYGEGTPVAGVIILTTALGAALLAAGVVARLVLLSGSCRRG